ncbi:DNA-binding transcriptional LysR family regulator [Pacificibacter maritimus]|uniref:DNA-binding transcriptional LysR family regulator n=1 Tax=Pacificibacter maritimus TaxID=762213 RepID=A0A3N4UNC7_9RHOB|nr:LysR family transcriptional regulator [Pacificibacter maritimus]RPE72122.1 DNA-binding transcriptional LysR family regulator [Pacificibacter maritimus]
MSFTKRLKSQHLKLVHHIAQSGKLQLAAEATNMSQPAASRILTDIETSIGSALFDRGPRGMTLTQAGKSFLRHSQSILTAFENLETDMVSLGAGNSGEVRIGAVTGPAVRSLVPAILKVKREAPNIEATLEVAPSSTLVRALEEGQFDFIISRLSTLHDTRAFNLTPAHAETVSLIVRKEHPLADKKNLTLTDLQDFDWTIQERGSPIRHALENAFVDEGAAVPRQVTNTSSLLVTLGLLAQSNTIATVVDEAAQLLTRSFGDDKLRVLDLKNQIKVPPYFIIRKANQHLSRAAARVLDEVMRSF